MKFSTELFETEGKANLGATIRVVAHAATKHDVSTVVVFAAQAASVLQLRRALEPQRRLVAVTFPYELTARYDGQTVIAAIASEDERRLLAGEGVPLVQGTMPFGVLPQPLAPTIEGVSGALDLFGGGMKLCVQALMIASDSGHLKEGDRCIVMCADTALLAHAGHSFRFLRPASRLSIEHILCKPITYQITRPATAVPQAPEPMKLVQPVQEAASEQIPGSEFKGQ